MTRDDSIDEAKKAIQKKVDSFKALNPSHFKRSPLFMLDVNGLAERVGKIKRDNRIYYICEHEDELKALIEKSSNCFLSFEALTVIYKHHYQAGIPCPEILHNFVLSCMTGKVKKPAEPKGLYEQMLDFLIPQLVREGKNNGATMDAIYQIISGSLNGEAGSPDAVRKRYQKLKKQ